MEISVIMGPIMRNLGAFKVPLTFVSILVIVLIILLIFETYINNNANETRRKQGLEALLILGSLNAALGMLGQIMGIWYALAAIMEAADISIEIVMGGLQASFIATYFGFATFFVAFIAWLIFSYLPRQKIVVNAK